MQLYDVRSSALSLEISSYHIFSLYESICIFVKVDLINVRH